MILYMFIYLMFIVSLFLFILSLYFLINKFILYLEFELMNFNSMKMEYLVLVDWISLMFISTVLMISTMVIFYSIEYMSMELEIKRFMFMVVLFVLSMILMVISPNMISILLGWDGLGLVSYCLVIYYQNESSYNSGFITVMTNRIGDIMILMLIGLMVSCGTWNFMFLLNLDHFSLMLMFLLVASFTKSAQIPFSSWLPMAMAAPTPVSSLVHSSTLVTAGVYLVMRFNYLMVNTYFMEVVMLISLITLFISGLSANFENDLKKIIAYSTLSQLGVMFFSLSMGLVEISFFHLLTHAMFKSMLFMCAGVIIHNMLGFQDIRFISMVTLNMPVIGVIFNCATLSLCGIPFLSGFFSKDLILEMFLMNLMNKWLILILFMSMGFTVMYSMRLLYYSFIKFPEINMFSCYKSLSSLMNNSMIILYFMSVMMGVILSWLLFSMKNFIYLTFKFKMMIYYFMLLGMALVWFMFHVFLTNFLLLYLNFYLNFFYNLWLMSMIYGVKIFKILKFSNMLSFKIDFSWNEYFFSTSLSNFLMNSFKLDLFNKNFFFLLMFMIYFIILMLF